jgi:hypothetical protein
VLTPFDPAKGKVENEEVKMAGRGAKKRYFAGTNTNLPALLLISFFSPRAPSFYFINLAPYPRGANFYLLNFSPRPAILNC